MGPPSSRPASIRRPLASATAALRRSAPGRARDGAALLPMLLDIEGAIQLAHALETAPAPTSDAWHVGEALARAQLRLAAAERDARQPLRDSHGGGSLISAERVVRVLERAGVPAARQRRAIASAASELFAPVEARALRRIASLRELVAEVRSEIGPAIAASSPAAARLEQIDAALTSATAARTSALFSRAVAAVGDAFAADLERAVLALPKPCTEIPSAAWTAERGLVSTHVERCEALTFAAFLHDRARVDMLLRGEPRT